MGVTSKIRKKYYLFAISCTVLNSKLYFYMAFAIAGAHSKVTCWAAPPPCKSKF
jgi:hypothetical protein